ncbi:helix-turn-helix transcriptional regulator [Streptomyces canus]|uniref:helix-turn-helix transcriptional regulator n=1 Tax=Streptomyces canus TaxID=58343 RepID=UPI002E2E0AD0|nr:WYL domain-containing protein [Streptomyces canus]
MRETSARLLRLLSLLQTRQEWTGTELAQELGVTVRTVRRDIERLRELDYPVNTVRGVHGGYRLGAGRALPPLLLDDDEAVAVALGLQLGATSWVSDIEEAASSALTKLREILPSRLHGRVDSLRYATEHGSRHEATVSPELLKELATICHRHERLRFEYRSHDGGYSQREAEPHRLVNFDHRWYLLGWDVVRGDWRTYRVDRLLPKIPTGPRFTPRDIPNGSAVDLVAHGVTAALSKVRATVRLQAPTSEIAPRAARYRQIVEADGPDACVLHCGGDSVETLAMWLGTFGVPFEVLDPPELRAQCLVVAERYRIASWSASPAQ